LSIYGKPPLSEDAYSNPKIKFREVNSKSTLDLFRSSVNTSMTKDRDSTMKAAQHEAEIKNHQFIKVKEKL